MSLIGMAHVAARFWLQKGRQMPREEAVRLVAMLAWGGFGGFPRIHEEGAITAEAVAQVVGSAPVSPAGGISAPGSVTDLTDRTGTRVETVVAETTL